MKNIKKHLPPGPQKGFWKPEYFLRYYYFLKKEYSERSTKLKNIPLVPKNDIKIHYIDFDDMGIMGLCRDANIKLKKTNQNEERTFTDILEDKGWNKIFDMDKVLRMGGKNWTFDRCIATDGVACSIRYYKRKNIDTYNKKKIKKNKDQVTKSSKNTTTTTIDNDNAINLNGKRVIGIDPGRKNIASSVELDPQTRRIVKKHRLTSKQYDAGITKHKKNIQERWLMEEKLANEELSKCDSMKSYST